ncbi:hypothetical protein P3T73_03515 [Kiritimatiellota bacterium B12222]|nr:hypothetical protein P3T73_03515 [Kiritimatiellota bacterium B12222]
MKKYALELMKVLINFALAGSSFLIIFQGRYYGDGGGRFGVFQNPKPIASDFYLGYPFTFYLTQYDVMNPHWQFGWLLLDILLIVVPAMAISFFINSKIEKCWSNNASKQTASTRSA